MRTYIIAALFACLPLVAQAADESTDYPLNAGDVLDISVWNETQLQREVLVLPDGGITFPLVGSVQARGRSVQAVRNEITEKLRNYITDPEVTVSVKATVGNKVFVIGQVNKPGEFVVQRRTSVLQALSMAGGLTPYADEDDIIVVRQTDDKETSIPVSYGDLKRGRALESNVTLNPGDVVVVPSAGLF